MIHRAVVTRTSATGVWITIASQWPGVEFGPCDIVANAVRIDDSPVVTGLADLIEPGDDVLVAATGRTDFVIVGTIRTGVSPTGGL
jgi:hypothetical protein